MAADVNGLDMGEVMWRTGDIGQWGQRCEYREAAGLCIWRCGNDNLNCIFGQGA